LREALVVRAGPWLIEACRRFIKTLTTSIEPSPLTVPYAERLDQSLRKSIPEVTDMLRQASSQLSRRIGGQRGKPGASATG
jgi:hypothetical protein